MHGEHRDSTAEQQLAFKWAKQQSSRQSLRTFVNSHVTFTDLSTHKYGISRHRATPLNSECWTALPFGRTSAFAAPSQQTNANSSAGAQSLPIVQQLTLAILKLCLTHWTGTFHPANQYVKNSEGTARESTAPIGVHCTAVARSARRKPSRGSSNTVGRLETSAQLAAKPTSAHAESAAKSRRTRYRSRQLSAPANFAMALVLHMMPRGAFSPFESFSKPWQVASHGHIKFPRFSSPLQHVVSGRHHTGSRRSGGLVARSGSHDMASNENDFDLSK